MTLTEFSGNTRLTDVLTEKEQNQIFRYLCLSEDKRALYDRSSFVFPIRERCTNYLSTHQLLEDFTVESSPPDVCDGQLTLESVSDCLSSNKMVALHDVGFVGPTDCASVYDVAGETFDDKSSKSSRKQQNSRAPYMVLKDRGNDFFRAEKYLEALTLYTKAIEEETSESAEDLAVLYQNRAAVFEKLGDYSASIKECTNALILNPKYVNALSRRSKAYMQTGFLNEAFEDVTAVRILKDFPHDSSAELADEILKQLGEKEATRLRQARKVVASPHSVSVFFRSLYNDPISVLWNCTPKAGGVGGDTARNSEQKTAYKAAVQKLQKRDYDTIIDLCTEEINNPNTEHRIESHHLRGTFRLLWGNDDEAVEDLTKVILAATTSDIVKASALVKLGLLRALQDQDSDCMTCFEQAEALTPDNVDVFCCRGQVLATQEVLNEAVRQFEKATKVCPDSAFAAASHLYFLYMQHVRTNNYHGRDEVFKSFPKLLRKYPSSPDVFNRYGQVLMDNEQFLEACQHFDKVVELDPTNTTAYANKAMAQYEVSQDADKLIEMLRNSLKIDDRNGIVYEMLGTQELESGNLEKAVEAMGKALEFATSYQGMMSLIYLKKQVEAQIKIKDKFGL